VCREINFENKEREIKWLIEAAKTFNLKTGYIITYDQQEETIIDEITIQTIPIRKAFYWKNHIKWTNILSATIVKNHRYYGWGIRVWFWPKMWIFNVSGFEAVELKMKNGKTYRIGTDEPKKLEQAILQGMR
jgi:hypothetical protein